MAREFSWRGIRNGNGNGNGKGYESMIDDWEKQQGTIVNLYI